MPRKKRPSARTDAAPRVRRGVARADGYSNAVSDIGTWRDPNSYNTFSRNIISNEEARALWESNDIAAKVIELRPKHAWRAGMTLKMPDKALAEDVMGELESIPCGETHGIAAAFRQAAFFENAYGGAAIFPVINDGADFSTPLSAGRMPRIANLLVLEARELVPQSWYRSIAEPKFGRPRTYRLNAFARGGMSKSNVLIHESRLIILPGIIVSRDQQSANYGFGHSKLNRVTEALEQCGITWAGIASLMHRIEQGVLKLEGFDEMMRDDADMTVSDALLKMDRFRSLVKMLVIGKNDDYQRLGVPLSGVPEILQQYMLRVAGAAETPATFLFGMSPAGQNATGDSDTRWFDDSVGVEQRDHFGPRVEQLVRMHMMTNESVTRGREPDIWSVGWNPLRSLTEKEIAERNNTQADADVKYIDAQVLTPAIVRRNRFAGDTYSMETTVTPEEMKQLEELEAAGEMDPEPDPSDPNEPAEIAAGEDPSADPSADPTEKSKPPFPKAGSADPGADPSSGD